MPSGWIISSSITDEVSAGVGDVWMHNSYVNFADSTVRAKFNANGAWVDFGEFGQLPTGTSPLNWLTVQPGNGPEDILVGYGQNGDQTSWTLVNLGVDPTTGLPYPAMAFDLCLPSGVLALDDLFVTQSAGVIDTEHLTLRWSDDAGYTWSNGLLKSLGRRGEYNTSPTYYRLGMSRNRIFEVYWSGAQAEALVGVWVNFTIAGS